MSKKTDTELALELFQLTERIKGDTKRADELKNYFKGNLPDGTLRLGDFELNIDTATRTGLDKKAVQLELADRYEEFVTASTYRTIKLRRVA